jgi:hypothetical protein
LFSIITNVYIYFKIQKLENKLALVEKELQQTRKDNQVLTQYIHARRKKDEAQKEEEEPERRRRRRPKRKWRRMPRGRRPWWWPDGPMRVKASRMFRLGGSSPLRVVQGLSLLLLPFMYLLLNDFYCKYMLNLYEQLNMICIMHEYDIIICNYIYFYCDGEL